MEIPAPSRAFTKAPPLRGTITVPGDKSISHRALMLSALAVGESRVEGLLEGEDVTATAEAMRAMGADIHRDAQGVRSEEHTSELQSLLRNSTAVFCLNNTTQQH